MLTMNRLRSSKELATPDASRFVRNITVALGIGALMAGAVTDGRLMLVGVFALLFGIAGTRLSLDPASMIIFYAGITLLIPSRLVVPQIGAAGTPALLFGLGMLGLWCLSRVFSFMDAPHQRHPLRVLCALIMLSAMASYVWMFINRFDGFSATSLDRGLLVWLSFVGVTLFVADSGMTRAQVYKVIDVIVVMGSIVALIGVCQAILRIDPVQYIKIPGLSPAVEIYSIRERFGVVRVTSTAKHPIEFSVVIATCLPLGIARATTKWKEKRSYFWPSLIFIMLLSLATAVSRSGILALLVALLVFLPSLSKGQRRILAYMMPVILVVGRAAFPGVIGTLRGLFLNFGSDNSVTSRVSDYGATEVYIAESPILGRGMRTFDAEAFLLLDNQILLTMIEMGIVGVAVIAMYFVGAVGLARGLRVRSRYLDEDLSRLGQALAASIVALGFSFGTFDATHYSMVMGLTAVMAGLSCALWLSVGGYEGHTPLSGWATKVRTVLARAKV